MVRLTRWACANVDYITLCPSVFVFPLQGNGLHKNSILGPGLEVLKTDFWVSVFILRKIHIHHVPAVWATAILAVKLCDVLERAGKDTKHGCALTKRTSTPSETDCWYESKTHSRSCLKIRFMLKDFASGFAYFQSIPYNFWLITFLQGRHLFRFVPVQWEKLTGNQAQISNNKQTWMMWIWHCKFGCFALEEFFCWSSEIGVPQRQEINPKAQTLSMENGWQYCEVTNMQNQTDMII